MAQRKSSSYPEWPVDRSVYSLFCGEGPLSISRIKAVVHVGYLFASEVRRGTSELTLFQKTTTTKTVRSRDMPPDADTALTARYYLYIEVLLHEVFYEYREWSKNQCH